MLSAVISYGKSDVSDVHGAVCQEKVRFFQSFFIYIFHDAAPQDPGKKRLEIGFVDPGIGGQFRHPYGFMDIPVNIAAGFFQIIKAGISPLMDHGISQLGQGPGIKKTKEKIGTVRCFLKMGDQIF